MAPAPALHNTPMLRRSPQVVRCAPSRRTTAATFSGTTGTYTLVDGGPLDDDGVADGVIVDPVLFGVAAAFTG